MKAVLVFCGSNTGSDPVHAEVTKEVGQALAREGMRIIYGAGNVGLMGVLADAALAEGGYVCGVIPYFLQEKEVCHNGLTELHVVDSMHERKVLMAKLSDAVLVLPGGYGTMDELFEMLTLVQLSRAQHPIGILNTNGFYDHLLKQMDRMVEDGFLRAAHRDLILSVGDIDELLSKMKNYKVENTTQKWIRL